MKWPLIFISFLIMTSVHAENNRQWWQVWKSADETARVTDRLFTPKEKEILEQYLLSQEIDDDFEEDQSRNKNNKFKKHKEKKLKKDKKGKSQKSLPPGLQKKVDRGGQLPPGWQKKVAKGEVLDGNLYEISDDLPPGITRHLENFEGTSVRQVEDRVVRILDSTGEILDVLLGR